jgi:hypothetical protein
MDRQTATSGTKSPATQIELHPGKKSSVRAKLHQVRLHWVVRPPTRFSHRRAQRPGGTVDLGSPDFDSLEPQPQTQPQPQPQPQATLSEKGAG